MDDFNPYQPPQNRSEDPLRSGGYSQAGCVWQGVLIGSVAPLGLILFVAGLRYAEAQPFWPEFTDWELIMAALLLMYGAGTGGVIGFNRFQQILKRDGKSAG